MRTDLGRRKRRVGQSHRHAATTRPGRNALMKKMLIAAPAARDLPAAQRMALAMSAAAKLWDKGWFLFPNPVYGPWDKLGRSEERPVGKECVSPCRSRRSPYL